MWSWFIHTFQQEDAHTCCAAQREAHTCCASGITRLPRRCTYLLCSAARSTYLLCQHYCQIAATPALLPLGATLNGEFLTLTFCWYALRLSTECPSFFVDSDWTLQPFQLPVRLCGPQPVVDQPPAQFTTSRTSCTSQTMPPAVLHRRTLPQSYRLIHQPA